MVPVVSNEELADIRRSLAAGARADSPVWFRGDLVARLVGTIDRERGAGPQGHTLIR